MIDKVFKDQEQLGIIEKINNLEEFRKEFPAHSFIPHMSVIRTDRETTKCRIVYLSIYVKKIHSKN